MDDTYPTVFVVVPVFNRVVFTKECLDCLRAQTYAPLCLIVVDGGSTDGTSEYLRLHYPQVVILQGEKELWWGGAMQLGIEYCLQQSRNENDMLLMMNNDTLIEKRYVETLVRVSREQNAAVGGLVVDSRDPSHILDAGEFVDWKTYSFPVKTAIGSGETFLEGVDLLSGRGTLVTLSMIRQAGNVNADRFPHYISDCEFFSRLKRHGFHLGVTYEATIQSHVEETGLFAGEASQLTICQAWKALFSIQSMDNMRNHWRFIEDCAPTATRGRLKRLLIRRSAYLVMSRTKLRHIGFPLAWFIGGSYYVTKNDCGACRCDADELVAAGILKPWLRADWYVFAREQQDCTSERQELRRLYRRAWNPCTKFTRWIKAKSYSKNLGYRERGATLPAPGDAGESPSISKSGNSGQTTQRIIP
jgi:GT2 family glycosyltransferase